MFKILITILVISIAVQSKEVCYTNLGCFNDNYPFSGTLQRPVALLPENPSKISTKFMLYNRKIDGNEIINASSIGNTFDSSIPTKFIVHGFVHNGNKKWVIDMKSAFLLKENLNVIVVDWSKGNGLPYTQSTANTQVVGAEIAYLIQNLISKKKAKEGDFHCIGHSLGSHICGYAGKRLTNLGRITGLDPAGPYFENTDPIVRLSKDDAKFVDVIHTDGTANLLLGLGLMQPLGHVDYYPNGGKNQPKCPETSGKLLAAIFNVVTVDVEGFEDSLACSHSSACYYYTASILDKCQFTAYPCQNQADFESGKCLKCSSKGCNRMGYHSASSRDFGTLYLDTQPPLESQFCKQNYVVTLYSDKVGKLVQARGRFDIYFDTVNELSSTEILDDSDTTFKTDSIEVRLLSLNQALNNPINNLYISYRKTTNLLSSWLYDKEWSFRYVELLDGDRQLIGGFCPVEALIQSGKTVQFKKC